MFGYVKVFKPELKVREFEQYRAIYCTVCKQLGKKYGHAVRMSLSYDFAFLAALGITASQINHEYKKGHCVYNPLKKCSYTVNCDPMNSVYDYVCAAEVIMLYYKLTDDVRDKDLFSGISRRLYRFIIKGKFLKACKQHPDLHEIVQNMDTAQTQAEKDSADIDVAAQPTADALGKICTHFADDEKMSRVLYRIGYCVGKWVYMADALDDLEADIKKDRFNPLVDSDLKSITGTMNVCSTEAGASFELIDSGQLTDVLKNIFYLGMPTEVKRIMAKKGVKSNEGSV